jgi:hypothetical protein
MLWCEQTNHSSGRDKTAHKQVSNALNELPYWTGETKKDGTGKPEENPGGPKFYGDPQKVIRKMIH